MSYLFKKRSRIKKKTASPTENKSTLKSNAPIFDSQNKQKQTQNSFQNTKQLRRVQLRGWK
jgi:hypothetical protein